MRRNRRTHTRKARRCLRLQQTLSPTPPSFYAGEIRLAFPGAFSGSVRTDMVGHWHGLGSRRDVPGAWIRLVASCLVVSVCTNTETSSVPVEGMDVTKRLRSPSGASRTAQRLINTGCNPRMRRLQEYEPRRTDSFDSPKLQSQDLLAGEVVG